MVTALRCPRCKTNYEYYGPTLKSNPVIFCVVCKRNVRVTPFLLFTRDAALFKPLNPPPPPEAIPPPIEPPNDLFKKQIYTGSDLKLTRSYVPIPVLSDEQTEAFWRYVKKGGPDDCWLWTGTCDGEGSYGKVCIKGKVYTASRVMWCIAHHEDPGQHQVAHRCDNPPCCNPAHLFLTDHKGNAADMAIKGRSRNMYSN